MKILLRLLILSLLFTACQASEPESKFPKDLLYKGKPIDPACVGGTMIGDGSRFEPKSVTCSRDIEASTEDDPYGKVIKREYEVKGNHVQLDVTWLKEYEDRSWEILIHESYKYIGSYQDKHVVITSYYDTSATGRFTFLGLVKREGDSIVNAGEIAGGDRMHGGIINVLSLKDNILRYQQVAQLDWIYREFTGEDSGQYFPPIEAHGDMVLEANLDEIGEYHQLSSKVVGLVIPHYDLPPESETGVNSICYYNEVRKLQNAHPDQQDTTLNYDEAKSFMESFRNCMISARVSSD